MIPGKFCSSASLESDTAMEKLETLWNQNMKKDRKEKSKSSKTEESTEGKEETISPKTKKVNK